jgi:hypothetical protein
MNVGVLFNGVEREIALDLDPEQETVATLATERPASPVPACGRGHSSSRPTGPTQGRTPAPYHP